jgi:hypothetical protein
LIFTDASSQGIGFAYPDERKGELRWKFIREGYTGAMAKEHINLQELYALYKAVVKVPDHSNLVVFCDNAVVNSAIQKRTTPACGLRTLLSKILKATRTRCVKLATFFVPTELNLADAPSRPDRWHQLMCATDNKLASGSWKDFKSQ